MAREGRDVISVRCMRNELGNGVSDADGMKDIWRKWAIWRSSYMLKMTGMVTWIVMR